MLLRQIQEIYPTSAFYGHASIIKRFASLPQSLPLPFGVQHGYSFMPGVYDAESRINGLLSNKLWVWSASDQADLQPYLENVEIMPCAAPFIYLASLMNQRLFEKPSGGGTIVFPPHSSHQIIVSSDHSEICKMLNRLGRKYSPIQVCMYYKDIELGAHHNYLQHGFHVFSVADNRLDPQFLVKFINAIVGNKYAFIAGYSTAALYSAALGLKCTYLESKVSIVSSSNRHYAAELNSYSEGKKNNMRDRFFSSDLVEQQEFSYDKLGADFMVSKAAARELILSGMSDGAYLSRMAKTVANNAKSIAKRSLRR